MARLNALNIILHGTTDKAKLAEIYGEVIKNVQLKAVSSALKNTNYVGQISAGSVEVKRFANSKSKPYGTARAAQAGDPIKEKPVTVLIDTPREIVEEIEDFDVEQYGVPGALLQRAGDHINSMARELDEAFFTNAAANGTATSVSGSKILDNLEDLILSLEETKNDFVDGVSREDMALIVNLKTASDIRKELDTLAQGTSVTNGIIGVFHEVETYKSNRLPSGVRAIVMFKGSIAQPVITKEYSNEKVPFSTSRAAELFYKYGTTALTPDLIRYLGTYTPAEPAGDDNT